MPVLDEAPMAHRNMSIQQQHHQQQSTQQPQQQPSFSSLLSQNFPDNTSNNASSPSYTQKTSTTPVQQQQQQQVNLNSTTETLNLPSVDFTAPSPQAHKQQAQQQPPQQQTQQKPLQTPQPQNQQQPQISIPNFLDSFTNELNNISPLSPKLTHFPGPRPSSSVTTFEKTTMVNQKPSSVGPTPPAYRPTTPNTVPSSPSNINFVSPDYALPASPLNTINLQNQLQQLVMQMGHLRQAPQNQQTMMQMQMLTRKYEFLYRKMELSKQMNAQQEQMQQQPRMQVIPKSDAMQLNQQQLPQLNIPPQGQQQQNAQQMQQQPQPIPQPSPQQQFQQSPQHIQQSPQHLQQSPQHMQQSPQRQIQPSPQQPQPQQNVQPQKLPEPVASPAQQQQEQTLQQQQLQPLQQQPLSPQQLQPVPQPTPLINSLKKSPQPVSKQTEAPLPVTNDVPQEQPANQEAPSILDTISETLNIPDLSDLPTNQNANFLQTETKPQQQDPMLTGFLGAADLFGMEGTSFLDAIKAPDPIKPPEAVPPTSVATSLPKSQPNNTTSAVESKDVPQPTTTALETPKKTVQLTQPPPFPVPNQNASEPRKLAPLQPQMWNPQQMQQQRPTYQMLKPMQAPPGSEGMFLPYNFHHPSLFPGMQQNPFLQNNMQGMQDLKNVMHGMGFSMGAANIPYPPNLPAMQQALKQQQQQQQQQAQQLQQQKFPEPPKKGGKGKGSGKTGGKGSGKGSGKGKSRPPAVKKKKEKKIDLELADFDEIAPTDMINDEALDPAMRRSLRDRSKKKSYKDDFEFNLSDDESKKAQAGTAEGEGDGNKGTMEPAISGGVNQLLAYRPNLEVEGEIAIIDKILAMRVVPKEIVTPASEEGIEPTKTTQNVEEYYVKYKGYSYLHCEWGNIDELLKKDKRVHNKVKRYQQKRDSSIAHLNELDDEPFNPDFIEIDRVLDVQTTVDPVSNETLYHYLVKWRGLPYEDSTWELQMNIDQAIIDQFYQSKKPPPMQFRQYITRPSMELEWQNFQQSPVYKNGHKLHDYQLEGLNWLTFCWYKRINCILADEMGLGKTIQSISLLCAIKQHGIRGPFLVIAPLSTIVNWQREFEEWSDINAIVYHGSAQSRNNIQQYEMRYKDENGEEIPDIYKFEAIITTYEMVLSANSFLCTIPFRCLIIDEAHRLKNQKCKLMEGLMNLQMEHRVLLTGTPLQNNVEELYSLLNFLEPTRFPSQAAFLCEFGDLKSEGQVAKLKEILKPMMLRRLKEDVAQDIGSKEETIVEVELTTIQKKFYRAILEKNFSFLAKGAGYSNLPNLMNTMMELRKCCNHPFLINGAEDKIVSEYLPIPDDPDKTVLQMKALIESSGKMVLIDKLLPKLKAGGHKILIFSQMIKVLNLLEDYLVAKKYLFERIDGGVQGGDRQAAIDRFCRPDSDRFVFLLCTRAGGLGINLTAADTVIIFDSDWNPQNDLQAQARCHRIGQEKPVKVYRLICRNTYEREMFDRASLKLGLDKAVLQNMNNKEATAGGNQAMSKKEVEDLLKKGAYGAVMETDDDASKFCEEDIDQILERRTQVIQIKSEGKGSTFAKASFVSDKARQDISLDDPDFWQKWAKKASVDIEELEKDDKLIVDEPRRRKQTKRFGNDGDATVEMSDFESDDETFEPAGQTKGRGRPSSLPSGPVERAAWTRVECFKIEKGLLVYGWGRWEDIASHARFRQDMKPTDIEAITRTILAYCFRLVRSDDLTKQFFVKLVDESVKNAPPKNDKLDITSAILSGVPSKTLSKGRKGRGSSARNALRRLTNQYSKPALIECDANWQTVDETEMIVDGGYRKHLQKDCHKIMSRVRLLSCLADQIIKDARKMILENAQLKDIDIEMPAADGEMLAEWWQPEADKSLIVGTFKHGYEKYDLMRADECLFFLQKLGLPPQVAEKAVSERSEDEKKKPKKENDDEDSFESDDDKDFSGTNSPASVMSAKDSESEKAPNNSSTVKEAHWPSVNDLNARLRRLINLLVKSSEQDHLEIIKPEKDKQRQEKLAVIAMERQRKKQELSQKWTRREEADFYRVVSNFGLIYDQHKKCYSWKKFRDLARLDKKHDDSLTSYFEEFMAMCRRVTKRSSTDDMKRYQGPNLIEEISEERANRCLQRVKLLNKIRCDVLPHELLEERLKLCDISPEFPPWWITGKHDRALLEGLARFGFGRTECQILMDPKGPFREIALQMKGKSLPVNGEHDDGKYPPVSFTAEFSQILPTWPKDKAIIYHMEKVCQCVLKGTWPKITRFDISSHVNKVSVIPSNHVSTVGHTTRSENVVNDGYRRQHVAVNNEKDFKIKRIDGLKLTVKSQELKKSSSNNKGDELDERKNDKYAPSSKVQIHIPKSREGDTSSRSKPVIHFPQKPQSSSVIKNLKDERESIIKYPQDTRHREKHHHFSEMERKEREFFAKEERLYQKEREERKDPHLFPKQSREERKHFYPKVREEKKDFYSKDERKDFHPKDERKDFYPKDERKDLYLKDERKDLYLKDKDLYAKDERKDLYAKERELYSRSTSQEVKSPPPPRKETSVLPPPAVGKDKEAKDSPSSEPIGIPIDSPNSNVRIQGSKIEINKCTKRDLSSVITKDNDLFYEKKRPRPDSFYDERPPPHKEHFSPTTKDPVIKSNRPERSAKKRAKDSITEMTEAENLHRHNEISKYSPSEFNSPLAIKSRDFYRHELYNERRSPYHELYEHAPLSRFHSRHSPEPRHHGRLSPPPPLHMLHERSLSPHKHHIRSPVIEKHLRSPSEPKHRHHHMRSPPPIDHDHMKHMKHHRALSPSTADYRHHHLKSPSSSHKHHHGGDKHFEHGIYGGLDYYHERSTSPLFYDHFDKKRYTSSSYDRASPPSYKHPLDKHSPTCMKHDKFPYHMSDSVADRSKHSKDEYRFPYGCSGGEFSRFEKSESPCHYQPLSRSRVDSADKKHHHDNLHFQPPKLYEGAALLKDVIHSSPTHPHHSPPVCSKSIEHKRYSAQSKTKITRDPPTSFYPTDKPIVTSKPPRPVIEIPEPSRENALPPERKTPTAKKRKGLGSLLESKILDLKKQRMGIDEKSQDTSPTEENGSSVIDTVSSSASVVIPEVSTPPPKTTPNKPKGGKSLSLDQIAKNLSKSAEKIESLSLDQIAKNLTKSAEKVEHKGSVHRVSVLREITEPSANTKEEEETAKPSS